MQVAIHICIDSLPSSANSSPSTPFPEASLSGGTEPSNRGRLKFALLALLVAEPRHGYDLRGQWESMLGAVWPLSPSQIYTALSQMERDELVEAEVIPQDPMPPRKVYRVTRHGRDALSSWLYETVAAPQQLRDDFVLKILFATSPGVAAEIPPRDVIKRHREACVRSLKELQRVSREALDTTSQLLLEAAMIRIEGNLKWLDLCEELLPNNR